MFRIQRENPPLFRTDLPQPRYRFPYWDSADIAAAHALACDRLYPEDIERGRQIDGTWIGNPFG